jgi:hypothetical protein
VLGDEDGDVLAVGTSPLDDGGHVQVPPVLVQGVMALRPSTKEDRDDGV